MKKQFFYAALFAMGLTMTATSCSDDDDNDNGGQVVVVDTHNIDYSASNAQSWHNYMTNVAKLLKSDAATLYESWNNSYDGGESFASAFKTHSETSGTTSYVGCIEQIIDGCCDIASEVGQTKIGEPYDFWMSKQYEQAVFAVESWYSWHSRDDYTNNIYSIRNSYYGTRNGEVATTSLSALVKKSNPTLDTNIKNAIETAAKAIQAIPQPFRNNIASSETVEAMNACSSLEKILDEDLRGFVQKSAETDLKTIVEAYVDDVILPTYKDLKEANETLYNDIVAFTTSPSDAAFAKAAQSWINARKPWEQSEAFLFGPVDALGLDPNMDSWPLDQEAIKNMLNSGEFNDLNWTDGDEDDKVEAAQNLRGFHTLEFLLFKDGVPRKVSNSDN
ncbi:MAG: peptidase M75 [Bacteroides sp.]|nr:hypothetical protein [Roseburia sp.]MCM1346616.1 peptidase M75 [Bacteroides sp.]MCM1421140.1 peptidase M75 [Bacteroides sp.]